MILLQARAKLDRANVHIRDLEGRVKALEDTDTAFVEIHPEHGTERLTHTLDESAFDHIALVIGDAVHNLACALDYTWLETVERLAPALVRDNAKFPVYRTAPELEGQLRGRNVQIDVTSPALFDFVVNEIQPYEGGNTAIWPAHCFANRDKHRLLIPVLAQGHINGIEVQDETGELWPGSGLSEFQRPPYVIDLMPGLHFTKKGKLTALIGVEDGKFGCSMDVPETINMHLGAIVGVVEAFESFLQSQGF